MYFSQQLIWISIEFFHRQAEKGQKDCIYSATCMLVNMAFLGIIKSESITSYSTYIFQSCSFFASTLLENAEKAFTTSLVTSITYLITFHYHSPILELALFAGPLGLPRSYISRFIKRISYLIPSTPLCTRSVYWPTMKAALFAGPLGLPRSKISRFIKTIN